MRKSLAIFAVFLIAIATLSMSVGASAEDTTIVLSVSKGDGSPAGNATIEVTGPDFSRTLHTNEAGDSVTIQGPAGKYTLEAYIPHPTGGKALGILLWGKAYTNQAEVLDGQVNHFDLELKGGLGKSVQSQGARPLFLILKALLLRL